jgi:hypothetical protein
MTRDIPTWGRPAGSAGDVVCLYQIAAVREFKGNYLAKTGHQCRSDPDQSFAPGRSLLRRPVSSARPTTVLPSPYSASSTF